MGSQGYITVTTVPAENNVGGSLAGPKSFYDAGGTLRWTTDAEGNTERPLYDLIGRRTGLVREVTGNEKPPVASSVALDMMGRVSKRIDPNVGTRRLEYDPSRPGLITRVVFDRTGDEIQYGYDKGRIASVSQCRTVSGTLTCSTDEYQYDVDWNGTSAHAEGRLAGARNGNTSIALAYDLNGNVIQREQWLPGLAQPFTTTTAKREDGRVTETSLAAPEGESYAFTTSYDSIGRPVQLSAGSTIHWTAPDVAANTGAYDAMGRLGAVKVDDGAVQQSWSYQPYSGLRLAESVAFTGGTAQAIYSVDSMTYQGTKLRSQRDVLAQTEQGYWYSSTGRLVAARSRPVTGTTGATLSCLGYSTTNRFGPGPSFGNLEIAVERGGTTDLAYAGIGIEGTLQAGPDAVTSVGSTLVEYDAYGRVWRTAGGTETFGYDLLDRLTSIARAGGTSETLAYDPFGAIVTRRSGASLTHYVGPHATVTGTVTASCPASPCGIEPATMKMDVHLVVGAERIGSVRVGPGASARTIYLHRDRLGSVVATTLGGGQPGASYRYSPDGRLDFASGDGGGGPNGLEVNATSELGYTGALRLSGGLVVMGVRVYYPGLRAFLQPDPIAPFGYGYVRGDPINRVDPTGLHDPPLVCEGDCTGGGLTGFVEEITVTGDRVTTVVRYVPPYGSGTGWNAASDRFGGGPPMLQGGWVMSMATASAGPFSLRRVGEAAAGQAAGAAADAVGAAASQRPATGRVVAAIIVQAVVGIAGAVVLANPVTWTAALIYVGAAGVVGVIGYAAGTYIDGSEMTMAGSVANFAGGALGFAAPAAVGLVARGGTALTTGQAIAFDMAWGAEIGLATTAAEFMP